MKKLFFLFSLLITLELFLANQAAAAVPTFDNIGKPASVQCTATDRYYKRIYHFDKIIFKILPGNLQPVYANDYWILNKLPRNYELDIKVLDDPRTIAGLRGKVLSFMGAALTDANAKLVNIVDVEYATAVCL